MSVPATEGVSEQPQPPDGEAKAAASDREKSCHSSAGEEEHAKTEPEVSGGTSHSHGIVGGGDAGVVTLNPAAS